MGMVFCRGCAKEIHESAPACPHCGAVQGYAQTHVNAGQSRHTELDAPRSPHWTAVTSLATSLVNVTLGLTIPAIRWNQTLNAGMIVLCCIALASGIMTLANQLPGRGLAITGVALGGFLLLTVLASP